MCVWLAREVPCYRGVLLPHPSEASFCRYLRGFVAFFSLLPCMPLFIIYGPSSSPSKMLWSMSSDNLVGTAKHQLEPQRTGLRRSPIKIPNIAFENRSKSLREAGTRSSAWLCQALETLAFTTAGHQLKEPQLTGLRRSPIKMPNVAFESRRKAL